MKKQKQTKNVSRAVPEVEDVDPDLLKAEQDVRQLIEELKPKGIRENPPLGSKQTPFEEEMEHMHRSGRGRIKGKML